MTDSFSTPQRTRAQQETMETDDKRLCRMLRFDADMIDQSRERNYATGERMDYGSLYGTTRVLRDAATRIEELAAPTVPPVSPAGAADTETERTAFRALGPKAVTAQRAVELWPRDLVVRLTDAIAALIAHQADTGTGAMEAEVSRLRAELEAMEKFADETWAREQGELHKALDDLGIPSSVHGPGKWYDGSIARIHTALTGSDYSVLGDVESDGIVRIAVRSISVGSRVRVVLLRGGEGETLGAAFQRAAMSADPSSSVAHQPK